MAAEHKNPPPGFICSNDPGPNRKVVLELSNIGQQNSILERSNPNCRKHVLHKRTTHASGTPRLHILYYVNIVYYTYTIFCVYIVYYTYTISYVYTYIFIYTNIK